MNNLGIVTQGNLAVILAGVSVSPEAESITAKISPTPSIKGRLSTAPQTTIVGKIKQCP